MEVGYSRVRDVALAIVDATNARDLLGSAPFTVFAEGIEDTLTGRLPRLDLTHGPLAQEVGASPPRESRRREFGHR